MKLATWLKWWWQIVSHHPHNSPNCFTLQQRMLPVASERVSSKNCCQSRSRKYASIWNLMWRRNDAKGRPDWLLHLPDRDQPPKRWLIQVVAHDQRRTKHQGFSPRACPTSKMRPILWSLATKTFIGDKRWQAPLKARKANRWPMLASKSLDQAKSWPKIRSIAPTKRPTKAPSLLNRHTVVLFAWSID